MTISDAKRKNLNDVWKRRTKRNVSNSRRNFDAKKRNVWREKNASKKLWREREARKRRRWLHLHPSKQTTKRMTLVLLPKIWLFGFAWATLNSKWQLSILSWRDVHLEGEHHPSKLFLNWELFKCSVEHNMVKCQGRGLTKHQLIFWCWRECLKHQGLQKNFTLLSQKVWMKET